MIDRNWIKYGTAEHSGGSRYTIWAGRDESGRVIYNASATKPAGGDGGYYRLESLLSLKGLHMVDTVQL